MSTSQSNIKTSAGSAMMNYSLFLGGANTNNSALEQYTPLKTGYNRVFLIKMPFFLENLHPLKTKIFKHLVEYGFIGFDGIGNLTLETEQMTGGYAGRQVDVATVSRDETNEVTLRMYEFSGSPVREYLDLWVTGIADPLTGLSHYHNATSDGSTPIPLKSSNHTMEAIYVATDPTGRSSGIEYACLLTNMMPKQVKKDQFNYEAGQHGIVQVDVPFTAVKYESAQINSVAKVLVNKYKFTKNVYDFESDYKVVDSGSSQDIDSTTPVASSGSASGLI